MARKSKAERKARRKKILQKVKKGGRIAMKISMVASRGAFLGAVSKNLFNLATRLTQLNEKNPNAVPNFWKDFGGEMKPLNKAIEKGLAFKKKRAEKKAKKKGESIGELYTAATIVAICVPILTAVLSLFKKNKSDKKGDDANDDGNIQALKTALQTTTPEKIIQSASKEQKQGETGLMSNKPLLIGGLAVLGLGAYMIMKKK